MALLTHICIVQINSTTMSGQTSITVTAANPLIVITNITNKAGLGHIVSSGFPANTIDGDPVNNNGWRLQWGARAPGLNKTLVVQNPDDPTDTAQVTLNDV